MLLLNTRYSNESDIEDISDDCIADFIDEDNFESFEEFCIEIASTEIKKLWVAKETKVASLQIDWLHLLAPNEISK